MIAMYHFNCMQIANEGANLIDIITAVMLYKTGVLETRYLPVIN